VASPFDEPDQLSRTVRVWMVVNYFNGFFGGSIRKKSEFGTDWNKVVCCALTPRWVCRIMARGIVIFCFGEKNK
jgi:hypothetical protein